MQMPGGGGGRDVGLIKGRIRNGVGGGGLGIDGIRWVLVSDRADRCSLAINFDVVFNYPYLRFRQVKQSY